MSELKHYKLFHRASALTSPEFISVVEFGPNEEVYLKSEADKVIAHQKRKRCLAMAKWCFTKSNYYFHLARLGEDSKENIRKDALYTKWRYRWIKIAEKFKEAK